MKRERERERERGGYEARKGRRCGVERAKAWSAQNDIGWVDSNE